LSQLAAIPSSFPVLQLTGEQARHLAKMKLLVASNTVTIPDDVIVEVKSRAVHVKGPRGELSRDFKHLSIDMFMGEEDGKKILKVDCHFAKRKRLASIRTVCSHVKNMITGMCFNSGRVPTSRQR
jgi:hypothetical protein